MSSLLPLLLLTRRYFYLIYIFMDFVCLFCNYINQLFSILNYIQTKKIHNHDGTQCNIVNASDFTEYICDFMCAVQLKHLNVKLVYEQFLCNIFFIKINKLPIKYVNNVLVHIAHWKKEQSVSQNSCNITYRLVSLYTYTYPSNLSLYFDSQLVCMVYRNEYMPTKKTNTYVHQSNVFLVLYISFFICMISQLFYNFLNGFN